MKIKFLRTVRIGYKWELVLWMLSGGVLYPVLCFGSLIMMSVDFVIPVPSSSPPAWYLVIVAKIGRELGNILFWPFQKSNGHFFLEGQDFWTLPAGLGILIGASLWVVRRCILRKRRVSLGPD